MPRRETANTIAATILACYVLDIPSAVQLTNALAYYYNRARSSIVAWHRRNRTIQYSWAIALIQIAFLVLSFWWHFQLPRPSYSTVVIGVIASIMAARASAGRFEQILWIATIMSFSLVELQAVRVDAMQREKESREARRIQDEKFAEVLTNNQTAFEATMKETDRLAKLSRENLNSMTGGDGYAYLEFAGSMTAPYPMVFTTSRYPLYDINIRITDLDRLRGIVATARSADLTREEGERVMNSSFTFQIGNIMPDAAWIGRDVHLPIDATSGSFSIEFSSRNGFWREILLIREIAEGRATAMRVMRENGVKKGQKPVILRESIDPKFPRIKGQIDWSN